MTEYVESVNCGSCNCDTADNDGVELSEVVCSVEFNNDESTSPNHEHTSSTTSPSPTSPVARFSIPQRTLSCDEGTFYYIARCNGETKATNFFYL